VAGWISLEAFASSPWVYALIGGLLFTSSFVWPIPVRVITIASGVFAAAGTLHVVPVLAVVAAGSLAGDLTVYRLGRRVGPPLLRRFARPGTRKRRAYEWTSRALERRGPTLVLVYRFVPLMRSAVPLCAGITRYPPRAYAVATAVGSVLWAATLTMVGYIGGTPFQDQPVLGLLLSLAVTIAIALVVELVQRSRLRDLSLPEQPPRTGPPPTRP
jgi:membrane-associated protein